MTDSSSSLSFLSRIDEYAKKMLDSYHPDESLKYKGKFINCS